MYILRINALSIIKNNPQIDMTYIDYGLNIVKNSIFYDFPSNKTFDLADVFEDLSNRDLLLFTPKILFESLHLAENFLLVS